MITEYLKMGADAELDIQKAVELLNNGEAIAFPTETVYGLGADIFNENAIAKIFEAKQRPADSPLSAHISNLSQVEMVSDDISKNFQLLAENFMPGPIAVIINAKSNVPSIVTAGTNTIAIRFPDEPICKMLIDAFGKPIAATSANISGKPSPTDASHVREDLGGRIAAIIDGGKCKYSIESTIVSLIGDEPLILRNGIITAEAIEAVLNCKVHFKQAPQTSKYKHYSPDKSVVYFVDLALLKDFLENDNRKAMLLTNYSNIVVSNNCSTAPLLQETFFAKLREADSSDCEIIIVLVDNYTLQNPALMERISAICRI